MDGGVWWATVHRVAKSQTRLSDFTHSLTVYAEMETSTHLLLVLTSFEIFLDHFPKFEFSVSLMD